MLLIGSQALWAHNILLRNSQDSDFICTYDEYRQWVDENKQHLVNYYPISGKKFVCEDKLSHKYEFEIAWNNSSGEHLLALYQGIAPPEVCLALKLSHRYLKNSPHFKKTMDDIIALRKLGYIVPNDLQDWFIKREQETYTYKHPNLKQSKKGFFTDDVPYVYEHDDIHLAVKHLDQPAYIFYKDNNQEVFTSKEKFFAVPEYIRLYGVLEEAYVLALERSIIPFPGVLTPYHAFIKALTKVCTSITSGWFREYAWENYYKVLELYQGNQYVDNFELALWEGRVRKV